jgi:hypothetical protein
VSKHTTCDDVDENGVKRLVEVSVCRCRRRDVDVGTVLLGTNKARKNRNPNTHTSMPKNLEQKGLTNVVKICVKRTPDFVYQRDKRCQKGYFTIKIRTDSSRLLSKDIGQCTPALAGLMAGYFRSWWSSWRMSCWL